MALGVPARVLGLRAVFISESDGRRSWGRRTASAEEFGEHVEGVGMLVLAALVSLQALFAMAVVYLSFLALESGRGGT